MNNVEELDKAMQVMSESAGSVDAEMNIVMDTYEKRVAQLKNAWQEALNATTSSATIKNVVEWLTKLCGVLEKVGGLTPVLAGIGSAMVTMGIVNLSQSFGRLVAKLQEAKVQGLGLKGVLSSFSSCVGVISSVVGVVTTLGVAWYNHYKQAEQSRQQMIEQAGEEARAFANSGSAMEDYVKKYKDIENSTLDVKKKKEELSSLQDVLVEKFGAEKTQIDLLTGSYEENIEAIRKLIAEKGEMVKLELQQDTREQEKNADKMFNGIFSKYEREIGRVTNQEIDKYQEIFNRVDGLKVKFSASNNPNLTKITIDVSDLDTAEEKLKAYEQLIKEISKDPALVEGDVYSQLMADYKELGGYVEKIQQNNQALANIDRVQAEQVTNGYRDQIDILMNKKQLTQDIANMEISELQNRASALEEIKGGLNTSDDGYNDKLEYTNALLEQTYDRIVALKEGRAKVGDEVDTSKIDELDGKIKNTTQSTEELGQASQEAYGKAESSVSQYGDKAEQEAKSITSSMTEMFKSLSSDQLIGNDLFNFDDIDFSNVETSFDTLIEKCQDLGISFSELSADGIEANGEAVEKLSTALFNTMPAVKALSEDLAKTQNMTYGELSTEFKELNTKISAVNSGINEFENNGTITMNTLINLAQELGVSMTSFGNTNEEIFSNLEKLQEQYTNQAKQCMADMQACSEEYYAQYIKNDTETKAKLEQSMNELLEHYGSNYRIDLDNYNTLNKAKAEFEQELMNALSDAWREHIANLAQQLLNLLGAYKTGYNTVKNAVNKSKVDLKSMSNAEWEGASKYALIDGVPGKDFGKYVREGKRRFDKSIGLSQTERALLNLGNTLEEGSQHIDGAMKAIEDVIGQSIKTPTIDYNGTSGANFKNNNSNRSPSNSSSNRSPSNSSKSDKGRELEEKAKARYQYIASIYDDMITDIQNGGKKIEQAISQTQSRVEYMTLLGEEKTRDRIIQENVTLRQKLVEETVKMKSDLGKVISKMKNDLAGTKLFSTKELENLDYTTIAKKIQALDKQIADADKKNDYDKQYRLEQLKALLEDVGGRYLQAIEESAELEEKYWQRKKEYLEAYADGIKQVYDDLKRVQDKAIEKLDLELMTLVTDSSLQGNKQAMADFNRSLQIQHEKIQAYLNKEKQIQAEIDDLRKQGFKDESERIRALLDQWTECEKERLSLIKQVAEARRQADIDSRNYELDEINYHKDYIQSLLDLTVDMIKQEIEDKKDALEEEYENKKDAFEKEYELEKENLEKKLDLIKEEADKRKKALKKEKEERSYNQELEEKQKEVAKLKAKLDELSFDTSLAGKKKYKEVYEEYVEAVKDLDDLQYEHSVDMQEDAIEEQEDLLEKKLKDEKDALEKKYKEEEEMRKEAYEKEKKELEELLKKKGELYAQANELIRQDEQALYEKLKVYASEYTNTTQAEFEDLWNKAYEGLDRYGSKSESVMDILNRMTEQAIRLKDELRDLGNTSYKDYLDDDDSDYDYSDDYEYKEPDNSNSNTDNGYEERLQFMKDTIDKMLALADKMEGKKGAEKQKIMDEMASLGSQIGAWRNSAGQWHIKFEDEVLPLREARRRMNKRHTGLETGEVGASKGRFKLKANEELNKLQKGEVVLTPRQSKNIVDNAKKLAGNVKKGIEQGINLVLDMHDFNITKDSLSDFKKLLKQEVPKIINNSLTNKGIRR